MVYLIHFTNKYHHSQHYIGYTTSARTLNQRIEHHRAGSGARLMQVVTTAGINWDVVRTWEDGDKNFERRLKNCKHSSRLCPICNPGNWENQFGKPLTS